MTIEELLVQALRTVCPRVFDREAPYSTERPYIVWQSVGGTPHRYVDKSSNARDITVQIDCWDDTGLACRALARAVEAALCASTSFQASPTTEVIARPDEERGDRRGDRQDFQIFLSL